jgi:hypothetical protein
MPIVDLNVDFSTVQDEDKYPVVPNGEYDFTIVVCDHAKTQAGRPQIKWRLEVMDPETGKPVKIGYNTVLPWITPEGQQDTGGVGLLVSLCKAVGRPWTGMQLNTDDYIGLSGRAVVVQKPGRVQDSDGKWVNDDDPANKVNDIKKFVYSDTF